MGTSDRRVCAFLFYKTGNYPKKVPFTYVVIPPPFQESTFLFYKTGKFVLCGVPFF